LLCERRTSAAGGGVAGTAKVEVAVGVELTTTGVAAAVPVLVLEGGWLA